MPAETVARVFADLRRRLHRAQVETADLDARLIVQHGLQASHADFIARPDLPVTASSRREIAALAARREAGEPISRLFGEREFYGRTFSVTRHTFDPRPDTETLVEAALDAVAVRLSARKPLRILELGTGSGAVAVSLFASLRHAVGTATDICPHALAVAQRNAVRHEVAGRLSFHRCWWFEGLRGTFDMIVANPPYLRTDDIRLLRPEVADHDPIVSLDGGSDGLGAYRQIGQAASKFLSPCGLVLFEIGRGQKNDVAGIMNAFGYGSPASLPGTRLDLRGIERAVTFERQ